MDECWIDRVQHGRWCHEWQLAVVVDGAEPADDVGDDCWAVAYLAGEFLSNRDTGLAECALVGTLSVWKVSNLPY